jgi:hypothetical protein
MNLLKNNFDSAYWCWTLATFLGSLVAFAFLLLASMMIGFDSQPFNWLIGLSFVTTLGLLLGAIFSLSKSRSIALMILISSSYLPVAFVVLAFRGFGPPLAWWLLFPVNFIQIFMALIRFSRLRSIEVTPCPQ